MKILRFLKVLVINCLIAGILIFLISWITLTVLDSYTHHGEALSVPDFEGMTIDEVEEECQKQKLRYEIIDSVYSKDAKRGVIVDQSPHKEFKVKENRTIFLTINAFFPEQVKMTNVVGVSLRQATAILETYGLKVGKIKYKIDWASNNVKEQMYNGETIKEGTMIEKWSDIDLVVGKKSNEKTIVPNVVGLTLDEAEKKLNEIGFNIGYLQYQDNIVTSEDSSKANVWKQSPKHHRKIEVSLGSDIDLFLTLDSVEVQVQDTVTTTGVQ